MRSHPDPDSGSVTPKPTRKTTPGFRAFVSHLARFLAARRFQKAPTGHSPERKPLPFSVIPRTDKTVPPRDMGRPRGFRRLTPYAVPRTDGESDFPTNATGLHLSSACDPRPGERSSYPPPHERKEPDSDQSRPGRKNVRTSRLCASIRRRKTQTVPRKKCFATDSRPKK